MAEKLTAILVGAGGISRAWFTALKNRDDVEVIAVADLKPEAAETRVREYGLHAAVFPGLSEALKWRIPDMVFDCTVPPAHCANSVLALRSGCHVLSEKPLAQSVAEARRIVAAMRASGKIHAVMQNRRAMKEIIAYRNVICRELGELTTLNADFYIGAHFGGFRDEMEHVLLLDMAIHSFDQARFIAGCDPRTVFCKEFNPKGSWYRHGASAVAIFTMSNGAVFTYRGSWCAEGFPTSWECDWRAIGTRGTAKWVNSDVTGVRVVGTDGFSRVCEDLQIPVPDIALSGHAGIIDEFIRCVKTGGTPQTVCDDNIKSLAMVEGAIRSAESGLEVQVEID